MRSRIPNILSASRIALCLPLLLVDAMTLPFWILYLIAGITDMLDGFLARRWGVESGFGARLDSLADFVFVLAVGYKLFPWLKLPAALWMMIGLIALIKVVNAISAYVVKHRIECLEQREPPARLCRLLPTGRKKLFGWPSRDRQRHSQCECSRQSILYILSQLEPDSQFDVRIENTILRGGDRCTFRIMRRAGVKRLIAVYGLDCEKCDVK